MSGYPHYLQDDRTSSGSGSPLTPRNPAQPPSFKPNVNRMKTKRWVNAKAVSYDGDDWGDSEDDEDEEEVPNVPSLPKTHDSRLPPPSSTVPPIPEPPNPPQSQSFDSKELPPPPTTDSQPQPNPAVPIIRPADIYKRMAEEREKERTQTPEQPKPYLDTGSHPAEHLRQHAPTDEPKNPEHTPSIQPPHIDAPRAEPALKADEVPSSQQLRGHGIVDGATEAPQQPSLESSTPPQDERSSQRPSQDPESQPISSDAKVSASSTAQSEGPTGESAGSKADSAETPRLVDRTPSLGFQSMVHQAFDAPATPSTTTGSLTRSDSDEPSLTSPILQTDPLATIPESRQSHDGPRPAGLEQPSVANTAFVQEPSLVPGFKPGHRRSLTPPSSENILAKTPVITETSHKARPQSAESSTLPELSFAQQTPAVGPSGQSPPSGESTPITTAHPNPAGQRDDADGQVKPLATSQVPPTINTPASGSGFEGTSEEHERLQDEIMRSLTPSSPRKSDGVLTPRNDAEPDRGSSLIPTEYDSCWNDQATSAEATQPETQPTLGAPAPGGDGTAASAPVPPYITPSHASSPSNPHAIEVPASRTLKKKYSWEMDSDEDETPQPAFDPNTVDVPPAAITIRKVEDADTHPSSLPEDQNDRKSENVATPVEAPESQSPTASTGTPDTGPKSKDGVPSLTVLTGEPEAPLPPTPQPAPESAVQEPTATTDPSKLIGFRQIMAMKTCEEKVSTFNLTRDQFAAMDSGLENWIRQITTELPEHTDLLHSNGGLPAGTNVSHRPSPSRTKFPKLTSLGTLSLHDTTGISRGHSRHGSGMIDTQQVQAKGKDLLHSAGVLGGKAGGAAKGFFAKSKSRFRQNAGSDKVDT